MQHTVFPYTFWDCLLVTVVSSLADRRFVGPQPYQLSVGRHLQAVNQISHPNVNVMPTHKCACAGEG